MSNVEINIAWLNPVTWFEKFKRRSSYRNNPFLKLSEPIEVAAFLATAIAKISGDLDLKQKEILLVLFQSEFNKTEKEAYDLLISSFFLFENSGISILLPNQVLMQSLPLFTENQARSVVQLLELVITINVSSASDKRQYLDKVIDVFDKHFKIEGKW